MAVACRDHHAGQHDPLFGHHDVLNTLALVEHIVEFDTEEHCEQDGLQHIAGRECTHNGVRNDVHEEFDSATRVLSLRRAGVGRDGLGVERRRVDVHAGTRLQNVPDY